jgi:hypothetical protein
MPLWGKVDNAANSTIFAAAQVNKTPNTTNRNSLYNNLTADDFITNATVGQFGVDTTEVASAYGVAHAGWVLRTEGTGGRAGRVFHETLVAMNSITGDGDDTGFPDYRIIITSQPVSSTLGAGNAVSFSVVAETVPTGGSLAYEWQKAYGSTSWTTLSDAGVFSNTDTRTLTISNNATLTGNVFRVIISEDGSNSVTSSNASITF